MSPSLDPTILQAIAALMLAHVFNPGVDLKGFHRRGRCESDRLRGGLGRGLPGSILD